MGHVPGSCDDLSSKKPRGQGSIMDWTEVLILALAVELLRNCLAAVRYAMSRNWKKSHVGFGRLKFRSFQLRFWRFWLTFLVNCQSWGSEQRAHRPIDPADVT